MQSLANRLARQLNAVELEEDPVNRTRYRVLQAIHEGRYAQEALRRLGDSTFVQYQAHQCGV